ncbi:PREDICTED: poly [ADP-ribose] polymerase 14 [Elephantulus edwardii]|uniref:poly [ADP-ribose] polymerase 14 n=1 Tax=Elephantulus edwardii TaxID=28737 RepID=UPI0003F08394|nr:PREDICTED: poly [ADP-ribose] polymerase 14 [Elephantulus edwardii]
MAAPCSFPLLVRGSWDPDPPKNLSIKLQVYFQSRKRSGGGECVVRAEPGSPSTFVVLFSNEDVRQNVLQRGNHELVWPEKGTFRLTVELPTPPDEVQDDHAEQVPSRESVPKEDAREPEVSKESDTEVSLNRRAEKLDAVPKECEDIPSLVVFENLQENVTDIMLTLLVENVSGLSANNDDFQVEFVQDLNVAVVSFKKQIDILRFIEVCTRYSAKQLQLSLRPLEVTKVIRVENLPPGVDECYLKLLFENPHSGGGTIERIQYLHKESSALVEFSDRKVLDTIMTKKFTFKKMPLSVFPYYPSLGTALYGKEKPLIKLPAPLEVPLGLPLWKFLQKKNHLIDEINSEMERCHCELIWPQRDGVIVIRPAPTLVGQGRQRIYSWSEDTSRTFSNIIAKYPVITFDVAPVVWESIKNDIEDDEVLIEFDALVEKVTFVGKSEDIQNIEPQIKKSVETLTEKMKKEQQSLKEIMSISLARYSLLCCSDLLEKLRKECPEVEISYDADTGHLCLKGLRADVYKVKCEIQEVVHTMVQKNVQVPSEVFQFLQKVDCQQFSKSLFRDKKILATYELKDASILLTGSSPQDLTEAEKQMASDLTYKRIIVEDKNVLKHKRWKAHISNLLKKHNSPSKTVMIDELTSDTKAEVIIAGWVRKVNEIYHLLFDFVEKHTKIEKVVELKSFIVAQYLRGEKRQTWSNIKNRNVQLTFRLENKQKAILLTGPKNEVLEAVKIIQKTQESVYVKSISIEKPGAKHFFQDKERYYRSEVRQKFGCYIGLQEEETKGDAGGKQCRVRASLAPGVSLLVHQGDLTQFPVEVVVNAANEDLKHSGGLAAALLKAAGPELLLDCFEIVKKKGKVQPGNAVVSIPGKLPCHRLIHAVGPKWKTEEAQSCIDLLKRAVRESLRLAEKHQHRSIAIPAISSGVFGFPLDQCVETIVLAIKESFQPNQSGGSLREIYLVDSSQKTVEAFAETVKMLFKDTVSDNASPPSLPLADQPTPRKDPEIGSILISHEGLSIRLVIGEVRDVRTDAIVNSISSDLVLTNGLLSRAILEKAGPELQTELDQLRQNVPVKTGTVLTTGGYNLHCQLVLHVVPLQWGSNNTLSRKIMKDIIRDCLQMTETWYLESITFPAIGTGNLGFPKTLFAELIISEVLEFSSKNQLDTLKEVHFLLHPSDHGTIQAFSDAFATRLSGNPISDKIPTAADTQGLYGTVSSPNLEVHEMKIGPIIFQVASGDITKEAADVIVNSTSATFSLKSGVSKAILEGAGPDVEVECSLQVQQGKHNYIITKGGRLRCKNIIHVIGGNNVKKSVTCILQECEKLNYESICLPAIGTGSAKQDPDIVAKAMMDAIEEFIQKGSVHSVKKVKVVIFLRQVLDVFYTNMKKREGSPFSPQPSRLSKFASFLGLSRQPKKNPSPMVLKKEAESAVFQVCGDNERNIRNAISWIQDLIEKEQFTYTNEDECIRDFDEKNDQELKTLQKTLNIDLFLDYQKPLIKVCGITRDVMTASRMIEDIIKRVRGAKEQESQANCISEFIEWQYNDNNTFCSFDKMTNLQLENAKRAKQKTVSVKIKNQSYTVDLHTRTATSANGHSLPVQRLCKFEVETPTNWTDMKQQTSCVVKLQPGNPEYNIVANKFNESCSNFRIVKIERVQNPDLWNCYRAKKKTMDAKNVQTSNEKLLFHGTDASSVPYVNQNGFNRSYAGKNAVAYGKGTYFAVNASYCARDTYSRPDVNGFKYMYYVRVLTGVYTHGDSSLIVPPSKNPQDPTDQYDTVTDNVQNPTLFVVFYDYQAYPEYLITFTK